MSKSAAPRNPFDAAAPRIFSIDAGRPFLDDLAIGLIDALGDDASRAEIYLPTRRAVAAASDAFIDACQARGAAAALLPRFRAIGDIDADELAAFSGDADDEIDLAPAVSATERMLVLAALVAAKEKSFAGQSDWAGAAAAARELGRLLDSFYTEEIDPGALSALDVGEHARHWARSLEFLEIVTRAWPAYLDEAGRDDPARRRAALIGAAALRLERNPPSHPVVIAGTTASAPSVARLVAAISKAPRGVAILPGLDRGLDARGWRAIDDAHPQSGMKALLDKLGVEPAAVLPWPRSEGGEARARLLTLALRPAEATDDWLSLVAGMTADGGDLKRATTGLALIEAENEEAEASVIAALFRETVETPGRTALLVTPDRLLARRVALKMRRWGVEVEDSAGVPFANTPCGVFLRLVARSLEDPEDPVALLALLRGPLVTLGLDAEDFARAADVLDRALRGPRPPQGLRSVEARLAAADRRDAAVRQAIATLDAAAENFRRANEDSLPARLSAHVEAAEALAGAARLWSGADGEKGAELIAELLAASTTIPADAARRYSEAFTALIQGAAVRPRRDAHPRLSILGPLEARLLAADHVILGGLNEGVWPTDAGGDPFLSRRMRKDLGLPSPERKIGLAAHDFAGLAAQPHVTLTRARRAGGAAAKPSRWIVRLRNILSGGGALAAVDASPRWRAIAGRLDAAEKVERAQPPKPAAGPGRRPASLSVTRIENWLRDPYGIYAQYLLRLRKLEEPGQAFGGREMGSLLHRTFELAARAEEAPTPRSLRAIYDDCAPLFGLGAADRRFWSEAVAGAFEWFAAFDAEQRSRGRIGVVEGEGDWPLPGVDPPFTITAKADRIDIGGDGRAALVDYKLNRVPSDKQLKQFSTQLALTGAMVEAGAFKEIGVLKVASFAYQRVVGRKENESLNTHEKSGGEAAAAMSEAVARLKAWIARFDDPHTVYLSQPRPEFVNDFGDYDQLARRKEWSVAGDGEGGGE